MVILTSLNYDNVIVICNSMSTSNKKEAEDKGRKGDSMWFTNREAIHVDKQSHTIL